MKDRTPDVDGFLEQLSEKISAFHDQIQEAVGRVDWEAAQARLERLSDEGERLGRSGWTLPTWATPAEVADILDSAQERPIDDVFEEYFTLDGGVFLEQLRNSLLQKPSLARWRPLVEECFWAYDHERVLVVVPAMITVVEGAIVEIGGTPRDKDPKQAARRMHAHVQRDWFDRAVWSSTEAFVTRLFGSHPFTGNHPPHLNRAWILHGRAYPSWTNVDCLRLFQAADTVSR